MLDNALSVPAVGANRHWHGADNNASGTKRHCRTRRAARRILQRHAGTETRSEKKGGENHTKEKTEMILIAILAIIGCGDLIFLGVFCQSIAAQFDASFYWWGIAGYISAGIFAVIFIIEVVRCTRRRRKKRGNKRNATVHRRDGKNNKKQKRSYKK